MEMYAPLTNARNHVDTGTIMKNVIIARTRITIPTTSPATLTANNPVIYPSDFLYS